MREYNKPEVKVMELELTDIICTSGLKVEDASGGDNVFIG